MSATTKRRASAGDYFFGILGLIWYGFLAVLLLTFLFGGSSSSEAERDGYRDARTEQACIETGDC
jgi:hypothetical protein